MRSPVFPPAMIVLFALVCLVALRSPHLTHAALASALKPTQGQAQNEAPEACPVTKPPAHPFGPRSPYRTNHGPDQFWYGTESLWTLLGVHGVWHVDSHGTKLTYWRRGFDWQKDKPDLTVVAKRLDNEAPIVAADPANAVFIGNGSAMMTGIGIPSTGCWKVTAQYRDNKLSFVVFVQFVQP